MLTISDIHRFLTVPDTVDTVDTAELCRLTTLYPFCEPLHWIYLRRLFLTDDITFEHELRQRIIYISDRASLYHYITYIPSAVPTTTSLSDEQIVTTSVSYYDMVQNTATQQTLRELAERLKAARLARKALDTAPPDTTPESTASTSTPDHHSEDKADYYTEDNARRMIENKKFSEALAILRAINLNNPKKSAYFALQIKYLETIINNQHKAK